MRLSTPMRSREGGIISAGNARQYGSHSGEPGSWSLPVALPGILRHGWKDNHWSVASGRARSSHCTWGVEPGALVAADECAGRRVDCLCGVVSAVGGDRARGPINAVDCEEHAHAMGEAMGVSPSRGSA